MTQNEQQVPASADHEPAEPTEAAKLLHGENARGEVYDQPEAVTLPGDTRIATSAEGADADN